jgi:hypothetical protein
VEAHADSVAGDRPLYAAAVAKPDALDAGFDPV